MHERNCCVMKRRFVRSFPVTPESLCAHHKRPRLSGRCWLRCLQRYCSAPNTGNASAWQSSDIAMQRPPNPTPHSLTARIALRSMRHPHRLLEISWGSLGPPARGFKVSVSPISWSPTVVQCAVSRRTVMLLEVVGRRIHRYPASAHKPAQSANLFPTDPHVPN